jgi:hypothetical protein
MLVHGNHAALPSHCMLPQANPLPPPQIPQARNPCAHAPEMKTCHAAPPWPFEEYKMQLSAQRSQLLLAASLVRLDIPSIVAICATWVHALFGSVGVDDRLHGERGGTARRALVRLQHTTLQLDMRTGIAGGCKTVRAVADSAKLPAAGVPPRKNTSEKICINECLRRKLLF